MKRIRLLLLIVLFVMAFIGCGSSKDNILSKSKDIIDADLNADSNISVCYYNKDLNTAYVKFFSMTNGEDDAVIMFDNNIIYYGSVYSELSDDDYDKIIEYGDYALYSSQALLDNKDWVEVNDESE